MTTREEWYAQRHSGTWRTARKPRRCDCRPGPYHLRCRNQTPAGGRYYDTGAHNTYHPSGRATIGLCEACAKQHLEDPSLTLRGRVVEMRARIGDNPGQFGLTDYEVDALADLARTAGYSERQVGLIRSIENKILNKGGSN